MKKEETLVSEYYDLLDLQRQAMKNRKHRKALMYFAAADKKAAEHFALTYKPIPDNGRWKPFPIR